MCGMGYEGGDTPSDYSSGNDYEYIIVKRRRSDNNDTSSSEFHGGCGGM